MSQRTKASTIFSRVRGFHIRSAVISFALVASVFGFRMLVERAASDVRDARVRTAEVAVSSEIVNEMNEIAREYPNFRRDIEDLVPPLQESRPFSEYFRNAV